MMTAGKKKRPTGKQDRRVRRTRDRLAQTIRQLIQQNSLETITVQDVLDKAGVSRSAFYAHFANTQDLLLTDMDEFLQRMATHLSQRGENSDRVAPVREFFAHVGEAEKLRSALVQSGWISDFLDLARDHFARGIEQRLSENPRSRALPKVERTFLAQGLAGALISQLNWWMGNSRNLTAEEMDQRFHRLVWGAVAAAVHGQRVAAPSRPNTKARQDPHRRSR